MKYPLLLVALLSASCYRPKTEFETLADEVMQRHRGIEITIEDLERKR